MSSKTIILLEDDTDGSKAAETVEFSIDGATYSIDLSAKNAKELRGGLEKYIEAARKTGGKRSTARKTAGNVDLAAVRAWAASHDIKVATRGRVSAAVIDQFRQAGQ
jgi:Lsr2